MKKDGKRIHRFFRRPAGVCFTVCFIIASAAATIYAYESVLYAMASSPSDSVSKKNGMNNLTTETAASGQDCFWCEDGIYRHPSKEELKKRLTPLQFTVTQEDDTEPPFENDYWDNKREGIYVDVVSGEPLFSSLDKYDSRTGWPSFTKPIEPGRVVERKESSFIFARTEVRSRLADSHLGHVFTDGPEPTGLRYCMNSAALLFIPKEDLQTRGYGKYLSLF